MGHPTSLALAPGITGSAGANLRKPSSSPIVARERFPATIPLQIVR
jgi:hypothetical protein